MANSSNYSLFDRALHKMSFGSSILQVVLADMEASLYSDFWKRANSSKPVFITSLPRAGTTIILEALHRLPGLAAHTYRDMPFIYTPVLWGKLSGRIRTSGVLRERAHGDGLIVSEDSPEAFEEVLWRKYFPNNYSDHCIKVWDSPNTEFTCYFREHMQKIVSLRCPDNLGSRYVSKNNGNIARTEVITQMFPDASIVTPFRSPIEHAISLYRQHKNFLEQHTNDDFITQYMADIGHFEFGKLHKPIQFPLLNSLTAELDHNSLDYWVSYWIAAYDHLTKQEGIDFISYENLCREPEHGLTILSQHIGLEAPIEVISTAASIFREPPAKRVAEYHVDQGLMDHSKEIYDDLLSRCLLKGAEARIQ
jgi:hypothetical protein